MSAKFDALQNDLRVLFASNSNVSSDVFQAQLYQISKQYDVVMTQSYEGGIQVGAKILNGGVVFNSIDGANYSH